MFVLTATLTEEVLVQVMGCSTAAEIWAILHSIFSAQSSSQVVHTRLQLASLKKGAETPTAYFNRAKALVTTLAGAGQHVSDQEFAVFLLAGLGTEYDSFVTSISTQPTLACPDQFLSHLMNFEGRVSLQSNPLLAPPPSANNTTTSTPNQPT